MQATRLYHRRVTDTPIRAGIYCRLSRAIDGSTEKVEDQARICRELAARLGWEVAGVYTDNSLSAWKKNRKRPQWDAMLAAVEAGQLDALAVYHGDRLIRHPKDLETLIDLADTRGIRLAAPTGTRNLDSDDDRTMMRVEAAFAWRESANTSRRKKAGFERMRREGRVRAGGRRAFGFARDGVTHVPEETAVIQSAAAAVLRGHSLYSITAGLRAQGILTTAGRPMPHQTLRRLLLSPRMAGLMPDGEHKAAWEPVLDMATWEMVRGILAVNQANPRAGQGALHLLSGIAACGPCGQPLWAGRNAAGLAYRCPQPGCGRVVRNAVLLDAYVTGWVVARLAKPDNPAAGMQLHDGAGAELAALTARRAETEAFIASLADAPAGRIEILSRALDSFDAKIGAIRGQMAGDSAGRLRAQYAGITRAGFTALPLDVRRALVQGCCKVTVLRSSRRGPGFRQEDVVMSPVTGTSH
jgi:site-specific DNA recombinase